MGERPERIDQLIPAIIEHDAVSSHTFEAQGLLRGLGFESEIYAAIIGPGTAGRVRPADELRSLDDGRRWILYQCSIGSPVADLLARHRGRKLLDYHNITPAPLVERWIPALAEESRLGRRQLATLAPLVCGALADSPFNARELVEFGFSDVSVAPVLIDPANLDAEPDREQLERLLAAKKGGGADWLFVGQLAAHKAQHDLIKAFACYRRVYDPAARLRLVGREMGHAYRDALERFVAALGLRDVVEMPGAVSAARLASYFAAADVFVCASDHEGYCAPVIESMSRGLPVVAFRAGALPETIGDGGVLLSDKSPAVFAAAVHELMSDATLRAGAVEAGLRRAGQHTLARARSTFVSVIQGFLARAEGEAAAQA